MRRLPADARPQFSLHGHGRTPTSSSDESTSDDEDTRGNTRASNVPPHSPPGLPPWMAGSRARKAEPQPVVELQNTAGVSMARHHEGTQEVNGGSPTGESTLKTPVPDTPLRWNPNLAPSRLIMGGGSRRTFGGFSCYHCGDSGCEMCIAGPSMTGAEVRTWFCPCEGGTFGVEVVDGAVALALMAAALAVLPWCSCPLTIIACPCLPAYPRVGASVRLLQPAASRVSVGTAGTPGTFPPRLCPPEPP